MNQFCPYCNTFLAGNSGNLWDQIIFESDNFIVTPTKGAIVPGWLLVTPKKHIINIGKIPSELSSEFYSIQETATSYLEHLFGPVTLFEHGPIVENDALGCGINHAHLHIVSLPFTLSFAVQQYQSFTTKWINIESTDYLSYIKSLEQQYLFFKDWDGVAKISEVTSSISQYFRKVVAFSIGTPESFDYKEHHFSSNVELLLEKISHSSPILSHDYHPDRKVQKLSLA